MPSFWGQNPVPDPPTQTPRSELDSLPRPQRELATPKLNGGHSARRQPRRGALDRVNPSFSRNGLFVRYPKRNRVDPGGRTTRLQEADIEAVQLLEHAENWFFVRFHLEPPTGGRKLERLPGWAW